MDEMDRKRIWESDVAEKAGFVGNELWTLLIGMGLQLYEVRYQALPGGREEVVITYENKTVKRVNVTGDSLKAIVQDVLQAL